MTTTPYLDQRAAAIRKQREGQPTTLGATRMADFLDQHLPDLDRVTIGAVLLMVGALVNDAMFKFEAAGEDDKTIAELIACLIDVTGEYLYAPPTSETEAR